MSRLRREARSHGTSPSALSSQTVTACRGCMTVVSSCFVRADARSHPAAVRKQIESGSTDPLYLLLGEDDVEKSALAAEFAELVDEGLRAFNVERIHAGDMTSGDKLADGVAALMSAVRTLPMMAPRRVVIVTQAEIAARAQARERGRDARARRARGAAQAARAADDARVRRGRRSTSAAGCTSC